MGVTSSNKTINADRIDCDGSLRVTLALTAAPDIISDPTDIVLVLDRSGSMAGTPLASMKLGAKTFIDIIAEATGGAADGEIKGGSRIGVVSFANSAVENAPLSTSADALKNAVDLLAAGGQTNHAAAFAKGAELLESSTANTRVMVLFTDGNTTVGDPPAPVAEAARAQGIIIYCIGLIGSDGLDVDALNTWATDPDATHVVVTPDAADLEELFAELAANIAKPGATDIVIDEEVNADFLITSIVSPAKGSAVLESDQRLRWTIPELGVTAPESAVLEFFIQHTAGTPGTKKVNASISYSDREGNVVRFPDPAVEVECSEVVYPEPCPKALELTVAGCEDAVVVDMGDVELDSRGSIIQVDVTIKDVCPGKRTALAAILTETDADGMEYQRGMKIMTVPAHSASGCRDVLVKCIRFVVPADPAVRSETGTVCGKRSFQVRFIAHSLDTDYRCCESVVTV